MHYIPKTKQKFLGGKKMLGFQSPGDPKGFYCQEAKKKCILEKKNREIHIIISQITMGQVPKRLMIFFMEKRV